MSNEKFRIRQGNETGKDSAKFPHIEVERKWMERWVEDKLFKAHDDSSKPKFYVLDMYPYPSGAGLHVGHVEGYTATDILSRYKRMQGFEVLHPMGWDAFGLPTENYAIKTGRDPHEITAENANVFRNQCIIIGFSIDWDREIDTSKEAYYKWTQKIFLDLYKRGLAYKAEAPVNWCTGCQTVLANEQVQERHCERCGSIVELRNIEQWFFRITAYADRLLKDLEGLDWPESTKERQRNWIGRTEGFEIKLDLETTEGDLTIFTQEPELLGKPSRLVIAPEHSDLNRIVAESKNDEIMEYISKMTPQSERERKKQKERGKGVFTGNYAINPLSGERMEIWAADYVLMDEYGGVRLEPVENNMCSKTLGYDRETILNKLGDKGRPAVRYKLRDWLISRERYWGAPIPIIHCESCGDQPVPEDQLPVLLPRIDDFTPTGVPPLTKSKEFLYTTCPHCGGKAEREVKTLDTFVDSAWYFLRFADPHNNNEFANINLLNRWLPVDVYVGGSDHATGHLLYARFITKVLYDFGYLNFDEPFKKLIHQGLILGEDGRKMSKRWGNVVNPTDVSNEFGSDALRIYEMFLGPLEQSKNWDTKAITGSRRFIDRVWQLQQKVREDVSQEEELRTNMLINDITTAIESCKFNIAVSKFMEYLNFIDKSGGIGRQSYETFLKLLAPFAPFITEELWERAGNQYSIHQSLWPQTMMTQEGRGAPVSLIVMINNKIVGTFSHIEGLTNEEILSLLKADKRFGSKLEGLKIKKIIYKPGKVFNILT
jgi:leucyl-tRNA synthetase